MIKFAVSVFFIIYILYNNFLKNASFVFLNIVGTKPVKILTRRVRRSRDPNPASYARKGVGLQPTRHILSIQALSSLKYPREESNLQNLDPKSSAYAIRLRGRSGQGRTRTFDVSGVPDLQSGAFAAMLPTHKNSFHMEV